VLVGDAARPSGAPQVAAQNLFFAGTDSTAGLELNVLQNDAPIAANDSGTSVNGAATPFNVLANDIDADGSIDPASVRIVSAPAHGTTSVATTGAITYTPTNGYAGADSFTYAVADHQGRVSNAATVNVTVTQPPPPPSPPSDGGSSGGGGGPMTIWDVLLLAALSAALIRRSARVPRVPAVKLL
jgi:Bacterial Ig domain